MSFEKQKRYQRRKAQELAEIGEIPPCANPQRREECRLNLFKFLVTYFPNSTGLKPLSEGHRRAISRLQACILEGGRFLELMYRGSAKTTMGENASIWAVCFGHRRFVPIFGADSSASEGNIDSIKMELAENDLLYEDFPEVCHAIRALEGKPQRCGSQTQHGLMTHIEWTADTIVLPTIYAGVSEELWEHVGSLVQKSEEDDVLPAERREAEIQARRILSQYRSASSGSIIAAHSIMAAGRGMKYKRSDGTQQRPDFVFIDDPQTDESAASQTQVEKRLKILKKAILKSGGHNKSLAVFIAATCIEKEDFADQLRDAKRNPAWQSESIKMISQWSNVHDSMWLGEYANLRNEYDPDDPDDQKRAHKEATAFYVTNRTEMDGGCEVSWEHCYDEEVEVSAIQHAYNLLIDDGADVFASECQNDPPERTTVITSGLTVGLIQRQLNKHARGVIPDGCVLLTHNVDVGKLKGFHWIVRAWRPDGTGHVIDYGIMPVQGAKYGSEEGLERALTNAVLRRMDEFKNENYAFAGGEVLTKTISTFDARWQPDAVLMGVSKAGMGVFGIMGIGRSAGCIKGTYRDLAQNSATRRALPTTGAYEELHAGPYGRIWVIHAHADKWKTFEQERWLTAHDKPGCMFLWGENSDKPNKLSMDERYHEEYAKHICAEMEVQDGQDRIWSEPKWANDFLDASWHSCCCAAIKGIRVLTAPPKPSAPRSEPEPQPRLQIREHKIRR